jgi:hypothetical protein
MRKKFGSFLAGAAVVSAASLLGLQPKANAALLNLTIQGETFNTAPTTVDGYSLPAKASVTLHINGIDPLAANNRSNIGNCWADIQTTSGVVSSPAASFQLYSIARNVPNASVFEIDGNQPSPNLLFTQIVSKAAMPTGFSFSTADDYKQFFDTINASGFTQGSNFYPTDNLNIKPLTIVAEIGSVPEPSSALLGGSLVATGLLRRRRVSTAVASPSLS